MVAEIAEVRALVHRRPARAIVRRLDPTEARAAFVGTLFKRHRQSLLWYLTKLLANRSDAEEVAQEAFLRLLGAPRLETDAIRARSYLFRTATNLARDNYRRRTARADAARVTLDDLQLESEDPPLDRVVDGERGERVIAAALRDMLPRPRRAFLLHIYEEMTYERIAVALGVSKKTIERDVALTLELCRSRLTRWRSDRNQNRHDRR
jgi:RNA polymerase sigma-70 factor (ECF subfamily)